MTSNYTNKTTVQELVTDYASIIKGKVILTTGVTPGGLGASFVEAIAEASPALLILAGRNEAKNQKTADAITAKNPNVKTRNLVLDLSSLKAVRKAAEEVNSWDDVPQIDVLVNNAAIMAVDYALTEDGFESQFATGHLGHFLFTNLIIEKVLAAKDPRVVSVSSDGHRAQGIRFADPHFSVSVQPRYTSQNTNRCRMAKPTTSGLHTDRQRRRTCCLRFPLPKSLRSEDYMPSVYTPVSSSALDSQGI